MAVFAVLAACGGEDPLHPSTLQAGPAALRSRHQVATPTFSLASGTYNSAQSVTLSDDTQGAAIYYTTDGSTPTTASTLYTAPVTVSHTATIEAIATRSGYLDSNVASATYTIQTATPTFSPDPGVYASAQPTVTLSDDTQGAAIYYTTDRSTPTTASTLYTAPLTVSVTTTINAIAVAGGLTSAVATGTYTIQSCGDGVCNGGEGCTTCPADCGMCDPTTCIDCMANECGGGQVCDSTSGCCISSCADGIRDSDEGDVDCGGSCDVKCVSGQHCWTNWDCASGVCLVGDVCQ